MTTKLHINASQGIIDVEGDVKFVEKVYSDFKSRIEEMLANPPDANRDTLGQADENSDPAQKSKRSTPRKNTRKSTNDTKQAAQAYRPTLDKNVSLNGLAEFYGKYAPKNNYERILLFCKFLKDSGMDTCTADQIYTCYVKTDPKNLPKAYVQTLINAKGTDKGYIEYNGFDKIRMSHIGEHHFLKNMKEITKS